GTPADDERARNSSLPPHPRRPPPPAAPRHADASGHGHGAAPDNAMRSRRRSPSPASASSNRRNIVATPGKTLTPRSRIDPSTASGENRSRRPTVAPVTRGASSAPFSPYEWDSGRTASTTSSAVSAMTGSIHDAPPDATAGRVRW